MPIAFACAVSHAPGLRAWPQAAPPDVRERIFATFERLREQIDAANLDALVVFTAEHWANFFLDHMGAFCVGRGEEFEGPVEAWLPVERSRIPGDPALATEIVSAAYRAGIEPGFSYELQLDHGTMVPLSFLTPAMRLPIVPIIINTLADPQPAAFRARDFGRVAGSIAERSPKRIGFVATGGMSHDPGAPRQGWSDVEFDRRFMQQMESGDVTALGAYTNEDFAAVGAGTFELLTWIALAGALNGRAGTVLAYDLVPPWGGGAGMMAFSAAPAGGER